MQPTRCRARCGYGPPGQRREHRNRCAPDGYFRALKDVAVGDVLELESLLQARRYRVVELAIVEPTDLWRLHETELSAVTLVTCYPFYFVGSAPQRYIVRAVAVE